MLNFSPKAGDIYKHVKRATSYRVLFLSHMQNSTDPWMDGLPVVIYQSLQDGQVWVRGLEEFLDGRFEAV